jgi:hypothetical protein
MGGIRFLHDALEVVAELLLAALREPETTIPRLFSLTEPQSFAPSSAAVRSNVSRQPRGGSPSRRTLRFESWTSAVLQSSSGSAIGEVLPGLPLEYSVNA